MGRNPRCAEGLSWLGETLSMEMRMQAGLRGKMVKLEDAESQFWSPEYETWSRLQHLSLESMDVLRCRVRNGALFELHALRKLVVSRSFSRWAPCESLNSSDFDAIARLTKITRLSLHNTVFSSAQAARVLPRSSSLQELMVRGCGSRIDSALLAALPPTLLSLSADWTRLFQNADGGGD